MNPPLLIQTETKWIIPHFTDEESEILLELGWKYQLNDKGKQFYTYNRNIVEDTANFFDTSYEG